jgi:serine/threonine protein kinase
MRIGGLSRLSRRSLGPSVPQELGSGSYAVVYKAKNRETDEIIALKKLRFGFDDQGLPSSTLREISLLKELKHDNIVE